MHRPGQARFAAVRDLFGDERFEIRVIAHPLGFGPGGEVTVQPAHRREMQTPEHAVEIMRGRRWRGGRGASALAGGP